LGTEGRLYNTENVGPQCGNVDMAHYPKTALKRMCNCVHSISSATVTQA